LIFGRAKVGEFVRFGGEVRRPGIFYKKYKKIVFEKTKKTAFAPSGWVQTAPL
jgi:hypothetical protein